MKYDIYKPSALELRRAIKYIIGSRDKRLIKTISKKSIWDVIGIIRNTHHTDAKLLKGLSAYLNNWGRSDLDILLYILEYYWNRLSNKRNLIIYPETAHLIKVIEKSKINNCNFEEFPSLSFILAMPEDEELNCNSLFVSWIKREELNDSSAKIHNKHWHKKHNVYEFSQSRSFIIAVSIKEKTRRGRAYSYNVVSVDCNYLPDIAANNEKKLIYNYISENEFVNSQKLNEKETELMVKYVKIAVTFFAYYNIYPEKFRTGTPQNIRATQYEKLGKLFLLM